MQWYKAFGEEWWGDITKVLTPFPEVENKKVIAARDVVVDNIEGDMVVDKNDDMTLKQVNGAKA